ncbi:MAG: D-alanyl-D-alanine carboxypeptidase family protein [Bacillota bacterium]|nr:D-alanyl-D-alanine carboxypeptidase family protein [Bacillota bacterium]
MNKLVCTKSKAAILLICLVVINICLTGFADDLYEGQPYIHAFAATSKTVSASIPVINAQAAIVVDAKSGRVLYSKNADQRKAIASTTKIMTAIIALEKGKLDDVVTVSKRAASIKGSTIKLREGEKLTLKELLYGLMLNSGNDAAIAIAEHIGGDVDSFVEMMNKKAQDMGLVNTNFKTPHGLDSEDHYSTANELSQMARYALNIPEFAKICSTVSTSIPGRSLYNTNEMLGFYPGADGIKTGYTGQAGRCLVCSVTRNDWKLISVVLGCPTRNIRADSSRKILDYAYTNYKQHTLLKLDENLKGIPVIKGKSKLVSICPVDEIKYPLKDDEVKALTTEIMLPKTIDAPIGKEIEVGSIKFILNGNVLAQSQIKTKNEVLHKGVLDYIREIFQSWFVFMKPQ